MKTLVLSPFSIDGDSHSLTHAIHEFSESLTMQADLKSSDINYIVAQFGVTGMLPYGSQTPSFIDFTDAPTDYHSAMNFVASIDDVFMTMPASVRSRFYNDAGLFMDFVNDDSNREEAIRLGIISPPPPDLPADGLPPAGGGTEVS